MYVCIYVRMYVCMCVFTYVFMHVCVERESVCVHVCILDIGRQFKCNNTKPVGIDTELASQCRTFKPGTQKHHTPISSTDCIPISSFYIICTIKSKLCTIIIAQMNLTNSKKPSTCLKQITYGD